METTLEHPIHREVRERYARIVESDGGCSDDCCDPNASLYEVDTSALPADITQLSLGCGDPIALASLEPGQTVLDLGSGAGMDCFLAAQRVGESGRVIGVDMTPAMLDKARRNRDKVGLANVEFRYGTIESLPVDADSVDVVISNCVINLSPDKAAVFREAYRALRPGGRLAVSDMVTQGHYSPAQRADAASWAACISGAEDVGDYVAAIRAAGFRHVSVQDKNAPGIELADTIGLPLSQPRLFSARVTAVK